MSREDSPSATKDLILDLPASEESINSSIGRLHFAKVLKLAKMDFQMLSNVIQILCV